jgi:hypothetical protein
MRWGLLFALPLLSACIPKADEPAPEQPPAPRVEAQQCHADLLRDGVEFRPLPDRSFAGGCNAIRAVQLLDIGTPTTNLTAMTCPLALQFARWSREAVQPAAEQWLDARVVKIESMGSYACRGLNGQSGAKLSEHGRANAVDIGAFVLEDGRRVSVLGGWNGEDERVRRFLRVVHQAGCRRFAIGLGPDANAYHRDHLHFDMGAGPYCR